MGKASSNKKVARAAGIGGGRTYRRNTPWGYFLIIGLIVVLGVAGTYVSRNNRLRALNPPATQQPAIGTTWNEAYGIYECGSFVPPISSSKNPDGIHTTSPGNGLIVISPKNKSAAGKNATLGKFASAVGMTLNAAELHLPGGKQWLSGDTCEGSPGQVFVKLFRFVGASTGQLYNGHTKACKVGQTGTNCGQLPALNPANVPLGDKEMLTIAFVPPSKAGSIPPPPAAAQNALTNASSTATTTTTLPSASSTTAPRTSSTTRPSTSTTAPSPSTTAK